MIDELVQDRPKCRHKPKVSVRSHLDLVAAVATGEPMAATLCCNRPACLDDARACR